MSFHVEAAERWILVEERGAQAPALAPLAGEVDEALERLIRLRVSFLRKSEALLDRRPVMAGRAVNTATSVAGLGLLFLPAAPVTLGLGVAAAGLGSWWGASVGESRRAEFRQKTIPRFLLQDELLVKALATHFKDFVDRLGLQPLLGGMVAPLHFPGATITAVAPALVGLAGAASNLARAGLSTAKAGSNAASATASVADAAGSTSSLSQAASTSSAVSGTAATTTGRIFSSAVRFLGVGASLVGTGFSIYELMKAFDASHSWDTVHSQVQKLTEDKRRMRGIIGNILELAVMLTNADPLSESGSHFERSLAHILTESLHQEDLIELLASSHTLGEVLRFNPRSSCTYSFSLRPGCKGPKGGHMHFTPSGWIRYSREIPDLRRYDDDRCVAYHGTCGHLYDPHRALHLRLLEQGLERPEKEDQQHQRQCHSETGQSIYVSPSIEYAAQYSDFIPAGKPAHWLQVVLECRVCPGTFTIGRSTLDKKRWHEGKARHDPNFKNSQVEWLIKKEEDVVITGMMVREFGPDANAGIFGHMSTQVQDVDTEWGKGPFFHWNSLRYQEDLLLRTEDCQVERPF